MRLPPPYRSLQAVLADLMLKIKQAYGVDAEAKKLSPQAVLDPPPRFNPNSNRNCFEGLF